MARKPVRISARQARHIWIAAQRLDRPAPFGAGPEAVKAVVEHLGYVQIDTINVIERCHHHILHNRIPTYRRTDLTAAQSVEKSVFEYWTHALSYVPSRDFRFFLPAMKAHRIKQSRWFASVEPKELRKAISRVRREGALTIRDIDDDELVEKDHAWASRKPSKKALQMAFYNGQVTVSARAGMLKTYELTDRHFGWNGDNPMPRPATDRQINAYVLDRALRSQGIVSLDSICHLDAKRKPAISELIERSVRARRLVPVGIEGRERENYWAAGDLLDQTSATPTLTHILSPFDPLIIQRRRTSAFFGYDHLFEAYVPKAKRKLGYFALPVLDGDEIVAAIDIKADRTEGRLLVQNWTWTGENGSAALKQRIEEAMHRFGLFQFGD